MSVIGFLSIFGMGIIKFLFTPTYAYATFSGVTHAQILIPMITGALFGFNFFYWFAEYFMIRAKKKRLKDLASGKVKKRKSFTRLNKFIVRIKMSKSGLLILSSIGLMIMSLPIGGIVLAKFYGDRIQSYFIGMGTIVVVAFILTFGNKLIFGG